RALEHALQYLLEHMAQNRLGQAGSPDRNLEAFLQVRVRPEVESFSQRLQKIQNVVESDVVVVTQLGRIAERKALHEATHIRRGERHPTVPAGERDQVALDHLAPDNEGNDRILSFVVPVSNDVGHNLL